MMIVIDLKGSGVTMRVGRDVHGSIGFPLKFKVVEWLNENIRHWSFDAHDRVIRFYSEEDATLFRLRFGVTDV